MNGLTISVQSCNIVAVTATNLFRYGGHPGRDRYEFGVFILGDKPNHLSYQEVLANVLKRRAGPRNSATTKSGWPSTTSRLMACSPIFRMVAAAIAAQTERIRIGTACMVAPFHDPIQLAERIAMVDSLSGGRFDAGFGRGYQAHEFRASASLWTRPPPLPGVCRDRQSAADAGERQLPGQVSGNSTTSPSILAACRNRFRSGAQ